MHASNTAATHPSLPRSEGLIDILVVIVVSALAFAAELAADAAGLLPWGAEARGVVAVLAGAGVAVLLTFRRGGSWDTLGFRRPARWWTVPFWALGILTAYVLAQAIAPQLVAPFFDTPQPDLSRYDSIRGNLPAAIAMILLLPLAAAIPEEIVYRGFLMDRLTRLFGSGGWRASLTVLVQALLFGSVHFQWGFGGVIVTTIMGAVWGAAYLLCGRNLWIVIIAHSTGHVALVLQLYLSPSPA